MSIVSAKEMMFEAAEGKYAVGAFNTSNLEFTKSIII